MNALLPFRLGRQGFTLIEMAISASIGTVLIVGLISASFAIQRSIKGTEHYLTSTNDGNRLLDYVAQDLRRAVGVGVRASGTYTAVKNATSFAVSDTVSLAINIPDVYASNQRGGQSAVSDTVDQAINIPGQSETSYRVSRYNRSTLNVQSRFNGNPTNPILNGCVPFEEAIRVISNRQLLRYAPATAGSGEIQVRYTRAARTKNDPTICFFRTEYPTGSETPFAPPQEIAHRLAGDETPISLLVTVPDLPITDFRRGKVFQLKTAFVPRYRRTNTSVPSSSQEVSVILRNLRRD